MKFKKFIALVIIPTSLSYIIFFIITLALLIVASESPSNSDSTDNSFSNCEVSTDIGEANLSFIDQAIEEMDLGISDNVKSLLLAQLFQESGFRPDILATDPWQSSESLCGYVGCITDPVQSTTQALKYHKENYKVANELGLKPLEDTVLQSYNFGTGYLYWLDDNDLTHSQDNAYKFSVYQTNKYPQFGSSCPVDPKACYGDYKYVENIRNKMICKNEAVTDGELTNLPIDKGTYVITQYYGKTDFPLYPFHQGIDLVGSKGTKIYAAGDGEVIMNGKDSFGANTVKIKHSDDLYTFYIHLKAPSHLNVGDKVKGGDMIGYQGNTGQSTGEHLHFEVSTDSITDNDNSKNPQDYLPIEENKKK